MIYFFYGSDTGKTRRKAFDFVAAARRKQPNLAYVRLAREELSPATLEDAASAGGLFISRLLVLIDDPLPALRATAGKESEEGDLETNAPSSVVDEYLETLAASDNAIVILAPKLPAAKAKKWSAKSKAEYKFDAPLPKASRGFNGGLVNALASRSREKLWLEVARSLRAGDAPEQLHGLLHWKARDILEKGSRSWSPAEAQALSLYLIKVLMDARRKGLELGESLERFALSM